MHPDDDQAPPVVREVFAFDRDDLAPDTLGLQLAEAKDLLAAVQQTLVETAGQRRDRQAVACPHCGRPRRHKDTRTIVVRTLFGTLRLASPRWWHCACRPPADPHLQPAGRSCCPSGPPRSWCTCRPSSPGWSPTA